MNTGEFGEEVVAQWLISRGIEILYRRWRWRGGEIDLIAIDPTDSKAGESGTLLFIEVKTRDRRNWDEDGLLAITDRKQAKLINSAVLFLARSPQFAECPCRFDVAIVRHQPIHHEILGTPLYTLGNIPEHPHDCGLLIEYLHSAFELT
jgi:putative endonuclease